MVCLLLQAGRLAVSQCFQSNGGYNMMTVIALLSNGTQGQLPQNPDQMRQALCGSQRQIVACIFDNIRKFNGSQQCKSLSAFIRLEQETVGLMNSVQQMCGTGKYFAFKGTISNSIENFLSTQTLTTGVF